MEKNGWASYSLKQAIALQLKWDYRVLVISVYLNMLLNMLLKYLNYT